MRMLPEKPRLQRDPDEIIVVTKEIALTLRSPHGGFTSATLNTLGIDPNFNSGWFKELIGRSYPRWQLEKAWCRRTMRWKEWRRVRKEEEKDVDPTQLSLYK